MQETTSTKFYDNLNNPEIVNLLNNGKVGIIPTDTVYGIVASALNAVASEHVLIVKGRKLKPGTLIAANFKQLITLGIKQRYIKPVEQFWPGSVSVILPLPNELAYLHGGHMSLPVRIPSEPNLIKLLKKTGPLITTSANRPDEPTVCSISEAEEIFGSNMDFYVDGGNLTGSKPSTIIRVVDDVIEIVRQGSVVINNAD